MALTFGAALTDRVNHGSDASLDDLSTFTILLWIYPTTLTANRSLWSKTPFGDPPFFALGILAADELRVKINQAGGATEYETNNANLTINKWWFVGLDYDSGDATRHRIYRGDLTTMATECTYAVADNGAGARGADAGADFALGNRKFGAVWASAFQGRIAFGGCWNRVLSIGEIQAQQFRPHVTTGCVLYSQLGFFGALGTVADWTGTGNNGTPVGTTVADHVPLGPPFARLEPRPHIPTAVPPAVQTMPIISDAGIHSAVFHGLVIQG